MDNKPQPSAEDYRAAAEKHQKKAHTAWSIFWRVGPITIAAALALMTTGIAWFVNNNRVSSRGMGVSSASAPYYLGCLEPEKALFSFSDLLPGTAQVADKVYSSQTLGNGHVFTVGTEITEMASQTLITTYGNREIRWFMDGESSNFLSQSEGSRYLEPGKSGRLTFYLLLHEQISEPITFHLELHGYKESTSGREIASTGSGSAVSHAQEIIEGARLDLLTHHILFFTDSAFQNWIPPGDPFTINPSGLQPGEAIQVTIYWQWPAAYSEFVSAALRQDVQNHPTYYFCRETGSFDGITAAILDDPAQCVLFYDSADSIIGSTFQFAEVRLHCST